MIGGGLKGRMSSTGCIIMNDGLDVTVEKNCKDRHLKC